MESTLTQITLRFPKDVRDAIALQARKNDRSMNGQIVAILKDAVRSEPAAGTASQA